MREPVKFTQTPFCNQYTFTTDDVCAYLSRRFKAFPRQARLFHAGVDVTPTTVQDVEALQELRGEFTLALIPQGGSEYLTIGIMLALNIGIGLLLRPSMPDLSGDPNADRPSPTNSIQSLANTVRMGQRVPDIYGKILHVPDLIAPYYRVFEDGSEVEYGIFCVGRGTFDSDMVITDNGVDIADIDGYSAQVYVPGDFIGDTPQVQIGEEFTRDKLIWRVMEDAAYQNIPPNNAGYIYYSNYGPAEEGWSATFPVNPSGVDEEHGHIQNIEDINGTFRDLGGYFPPGSTLSIHGVYESDGSPPPTPIHAGIIGDYRVLRSSKTDVWLEIPEDKQAAWDAISETAGPSDVLLEMEQTCPWIEYDGITATKRIEMSFEAPGGLYNAYPFDSTAVEIDLEVTTVWTDANDNEDSVTTTFAMAGSSGYGFGITEGHDNPFEDDRTCSVLVKFRRTDAYRPFYPLTWGSNSNYRVDLKYVYASLDKDAYSDPAEVTTIFTRVRNTYATRSIERRKLHVEVQRSLGRSFVDSLTDIIADTRIGRLTSANIGDWDGAYDDLLTYFGDAKYLYFDHCFDKLDISFEDIVATIATRVFAQAYRLGDIIEIRPIIEEDTRTLLFNHRNKIPGSEVRRVRFGIENDHDGVIVKWRDPDNDDALEEYETPSDPGVPKMIEIAGIRDEDVAEVHAKRAWNEMQYINMTTEFVATHEAALLLPGDIILVADNTQPQIQDGELVNQPSATELTLSCDVTMIAGESYTIWLQQTDGTVLSYALVNAEGTTNEIELASDPGITFETAADNYARTTFLIVNDADDDISAFRVLSVSPSGKMTYTVKAAKYDEAAYGDDPA